MNKEQGSHKMKKNLGQNFLRDMGIVEEILRVAEIGEDDRILEIGPGDGALTAHLLSRAGRVSAIELDAELIPRLSDRFKESGNLSLLEGNVLELDVSQYLSESGFEDGKYKVVANIPYYITAPIIRMLLSLSIRPERIVLMVQEEVAERLAASPGKMSILSVMAQYYADVRKEIFVPKTAFYPVPKVDSMIVKLVPKRTFDREEDRKLFRVVRAGFAARRKTLSNNISSSFHIPRDEVEAIFSEIGLDPMIRAQELHVGDWERLAALIAARPE
jgi:16S rRNA (adenine1518-N6/adenine1519-N6)-dimethyltransferase